MDNHPSCRRLHKIPAHTFKDPGKWPQRRSRVLRSFLRSEPPIIAGFSASSTPFFKAASPGWTLLPMLLRRWTRRSFVVASRLLCRTFRVRQHLRSIISFGGGGRPVAAEAPWWRPLRRGRRSMSLFPSFVKGVWRFFSPDVASVHPSRCGRTARTASQAWAWLCKSIRKGRLRRPFLCLSQRPSVRGRRCACRPATGLRSPAAAPAGRLRPPHRPP